MDIISEIKKLKEEKDAVILAHFYVDGAIQDIADYVGDSYALAKAANSDPRKTIVFCGVTFMGESAATLNPDKTVLVPRDDAHCAMAMMVDHDEIARMREQYEDLAVVCYINSNGSTKALSDVIVTSSNALKIVNALPNKNIFFIPDCNLGSYVKAMCPDKNVMLSSGYCPIHNNLTVAEVEKLKAEHPTAKILTHPECQKVIVDMSDYIGSTKGIIEYATASEDKEFIILTEQGVGHELKKRNPDKQFYFVDSQICPDMKKLTLESVRDCLKNGAPRAIVSDELRALASKPLDKMLELAK